jgi:predicted AlkP superfamily pyrophosphatase or phosphodiesterase
MDRSATSRRLVVLLIDGLRADTARPPSSSASR